MTDVVDEHIAGLEAEIEQLENKLADAEACNARLVEQVESLTAERDELQEKLDKRLQQLYLIDLSAVQNELDDWKADTERLMIRDQYVCPYCGARLVNSRMNHIPNCPIALHRQLVEKYEVRGCTNADH